MVAGEDPNEDPPPNDPPPNDPPPNDDPPKDNDGEFSGKKFNSWGVKLWLKFVELTFHSQVAAFAASIWNLL